MLHVLNSSSKVFNSPLLLTFGTGFAWFSIQYLPSEMIMFWLVLAVLMDLITGLLKAWSKGEATTSTGLRRTITKIGSYVVTIVAVIILVNVIGISAKDNNEYLTLLIDALMAFMVFIELYSIMENIDEAYPDSALSKFLIRPMLKFLKGKLKKNPLNEIDVPTTKDRS